MKRVKVMINGWSFEFDCLTYRLYTDASDNTGVSVHFLTENEKEQLYNQTV